MKKNINKASEVKNSNPVAKKNAVITEAEVKIVHRREDIKIRLALLMFITWVQALGIEVSHVMCVLHALFVEVLFLFGERERDLHELEEHIHNALLERRVIVVPDNVETVLDRLFRRRTSAAFRRDEIRPVLFAETLVRILYLVFELVVSQFAELLPAP